MASLALAVSDATPAIERFAEALERLLLARIGDPDLTPRNLALRLGTDSHTLDLWIQAAQGMSASEYLMQRRLDHVVELIRDRHLDVETAALHSGFRTLDAFLQAFDRRYGVPVLREPATATSRDDHEGP